MKCDPNDKVCSLLLETVVPILGVCTAVATTVAPFKTILLIRRVKTLGSVNPIPYGFIYVNALIWILYGLLCKDPYVTAPNTIGILMGAFYTRTAYIYSTPVQRNFLDGITLSLSFISYIGAMIAYLAVPQEVGLKILGWLAIMILGLFYSSPLSVFAKVIQTRNAAPFHTPLAITCLLNGALWSAYGLVRNDPFIYVPNMLGAVVAIVQLVFKGIFPSINEDGESLGSDEDIDDRAKINQSKHTSEA
jgi:solute carrier family 50 protein (sugar transporter)